MKIPCTLVLALLGSNACFADTGPAPATTVTYADLNLSTPSGVAALYQRIERAAAEVCQLPQGTRQLKLEAELKACRVEATDRAVGQANLPKLTAMHFEKTGRQVGPAQLADRR